MNATSIKILEAAAEIVGGKEALAERLGISETVHARYMEGHRALADALLLHVVDIILNDRQSRHPARRHAAFQAAGLPVSEP